MGIWGLAWIVSLIGLHYRWWAIDYEHMWIPFYPDHPVTGMLPETRFILTFLIGAIFLWITRYFIWRYECRILCRVHRVSHNDLEYRSYGRATWKMSKAHTILCLTWWIALLKWFWMLRCIAAILGTYPN
jgi:hypothetical protein